MAIIAADRRCTSSGFDSIGGSASVRISRNALQNPITPAHTKIHASFIASSPSSATIDVACRTRNGQRFRVRRCAYMSISREAGICTQLSAESAAFSRPAWPRAAR